METRESCYTISENLTWYSHYGLRVPWTARRSNQSIPKEFNPEYSLKRLILKLRLQYFGHQIWRADWLEKTLMLGKTECKRRRGQQRMRWLDSITNSMDMNLSKLRKIVKERRPWHIVVHEVAKSQTWFSKWTTIATMENSIKKKERKLKVELLYDPAIPFLSMYLKENTVWKEAYTPVFTAVLFTIARQVLCYTKSLQWCQTLCDPMESARLLCPCHSPGKNTGVGCHHLLQGTFPSQGPNPHHWCALHWQMSATWESRHGSNLDVHWLIHG